MKKIGKIIIIICILMCFSLESSAMEEADEHIENFESILPEGLEGAASEPDALDSYIGPGALLSHIVSAFSDEAPRVALFFLLLLGGIAILSLSESFGGRLSEPAGAGISLIISASITAYSIGIFKEVSLALTKISDFFALLSPVMVGVHASSGAVHTAASAAMGMNLTLAIITDMLVPFFTQLAAFGLAVATLSALGDDAVMPISSGVKSFFFWAIGLASACLMGAMALQSFVSAARDSAAMRAAKYAASSLIPVVGGTVSASMATLWTGISYAKSIIGAGAVAVIISIFLSPLIMLLLYRTALSLAAGVAAAIGISRAERTLGVFRVAYDIYIAVFALASIIYIFEIALFAVSGSGWGG